MNKFYKWLNNYPGIRIILIMLVFGTPLMAFDHAALYLSQNNQMVLSYVFRFFFSFILFILCDLAFPIKKQNK